MAYLTNPIPLGLAPEEINALKLFIFDLPPDLEEAIGSNQLTADQIDELSALIIGDLDFFQQLEDTRSIFEKLTPHLRLEAGFNADLEQILDRWGFIPSRIPEAKNNRMPDYDWPPIEVKITRNDQGAQWIRVEIMSFDDAFTILPDRLKFDFHQRATASDSINLIAFRNKKPIGFSTNKIMRFGGTHEQLKPYENQWVMHATETNKVDDGIKGFAFAMLIARLRYMQDHDLLTQTEEYEPVMWNVLEPFLKSWCRKIGYPISPELAEIHKTGVLTHGVAQAALEFAEHEEYTRTAETPITISADDSRISIQEELPVTEITITSENDPGTQTEYEAETPSETVSVEISHRTVAALAQRRARMGGLRGR